MANKNINILLALKDQFTKPMRSVTKETKAAQKQIKASSNVIKSWASSANSKFKSVASAAGKVGAAVLTLGGAISVAGVKAWSEEAMEGFNAAKEAETKLEAVLKNVPSIISQGADVATAAKDRLVAYTDQMEETGVVAGDVSIAGLQQLATFQLTEESLKKLTPGMADLVAQQKGLNATQEDAVSIGNLIGKAMTGQTGALSKAGIIMSEYQANVMKTGTEAERAAMMAEILQQNVGGVNEALAKTDAGKIKVAENLYGRMSDAVGEGLMSIKAQLAGMAAGAIPSVQKKLVGLVAKLKIKINDAVAYLQAHKEEITAALTAAKNTLAQVFTVASKLIGWLIQHGNTLIPILAGVVAGFTAFNVISTIIPVIKTLQTVITGLKAASSVAGVLSALGGPLVLIPVLIAAVVAAGVLLYQNWDTIKAKALELWDKVKAVFGGIRDAISGAFTGAKNAVKGAIDWIGEKIGWLGEKIKSVPILGTAISAVQAVGGAVKSAFTGHATGTSYFKGGLTRINEGGRGEIVDLPNGSRIIPHDVAQKTGGGRSVVLNLKLIIQGNVIGNREFMEQTGRYVAERVVEAIETT